MTPSLNRDREADRVTAVGTYMLADREGGPAIDALVRLASRICEVPMAMVGLVDDHREWLLSTIGLGEVRALPREHTFCTHALAQTHPLLVEDASKDPRFDTNPLVTSAPSVRFYAGVPLINPQGFALGALCVVDRKPRVLRPDQLDALNDISVAVMELLEARRVAQDRRHALEGVKQLAAEREDARVRAEQRNDLLRLAEDVAQLGHWRFDLTDNQVYWSPQVYRIHGRDPATFRPTLDNAIDSYHPDDRAFVVSALATAIERHQPFDFELRVIRADGEVRRVHSRGRDEYDLQTGKVRAVFGVFQDITDREVMRERMERRDRLVTTGTLAAGVGHEINNPLTYVTANIDFALEELRSSLFANLPISPIVAQLVDVLSESREGADRIRRIVRGLAAFAREEASPVPTNVQATIEMSINMAMHELRHRATLVRELETVPPVMGDETRLSQVLVNLLVNASQAFTNEDAAKNVVVVATHLDERGRVVVEVRDNGPGIPADIVPRIFDPFFTTKPVGQGTGLGLSICHNVVASLGGEITCSTVVGSGTVFRVALPAAPSDASAGPKSSATPVVPARGRILLVDDEESVLRAMSRLLSLDHDVVALSDPREALRRLVDEGEAYDVVFCDVMMPHVSGMELYRRVREQRPILAERFVFVTAGGANEEAFDFLAQTTNERLDKPFANHRFRAIARRLIASSRSDKR